MSLVIEHQLHEKCRICLEIKTELSSFFAPLYQIKDEEYEKGTSCRWYSLAEILQSISTVGVEIFDDLPEQVCQACIGRIVAFQDFLKTFQKNQSYLREIIDNWSVVQSYSKEEICETKLNEVYLEDSLGNEEGESGGESYESNSPLDDLRDASSVHVTKNFEVETENKSIELDLKSIEFDKNKNIELDKNEIVCAKYSCEECGDCFLIKSGFSLHMMQKHQICVQVEEFEKYSSQITIQMPENFSEKVLKYVPKPPPKQKVNQFQCRICKSTFSSDFEFKSHKEVHRIHKCPQCDSAFTKSSYLKDHSLVHTSTKLFGCDICGKTFKYRNGLSVHKMIHENFRGNICDTCGKGFNARSTLYTHIKLKHHGEKKFSCPDCNFSFKEKSWLNKHILRKHSGSRTKDFVCSVCGIAYLNKYTLNRHMSDKHTGTPKRYYCTICDKSYTMRNKLNTHLEKKHFLAVDNDKRLTML